MNATYRWFPAATFLLLLLAPARSQTVVIASCPGATPFYAPGQAGLPYAIDVNGNVCISGIGGGGGGGGTSSNFGAGFPTAGTAIGFTNGTTMATGYVTSAPITDNMVPPAANVLHVMNYNLVYNSGTSSWDRAISVLPGTAGVASTQVLTVQGIASMTALQVAQATAANFNATVVNGGTFAVQPLPSTAGGLLVYFVQPTAGDNHANIKNGAGQVYKISVTNNSATPNYLRLYDAASGFNGCNSATNLKYQIAIPASTVIGGISDSWDMGMAFTSGISICVTSGYSTIDTMNATASAMSVNIGYKHGLDDQDWSWLVGGSDNSILPWRQEM